MRRALIGIAAAGLIIGLAAMLVGRADIARWPWITGTAPVIAALAFSIIRDLRAGRMGVDLLAFLSMTAALALGEALAGVIVAVMYAGGQALEDFAVGRAERDLKTLIDRAPRIAHRKRGGALEDIPIEDIALWDAILVRVGEIVPIDGQVVSPSALIDESVLTGEPIPVMRQVGEAVSSGTINVGETFEMHATATAGDSAYAGIVRMVTVAQTAKVPFIRMADRFALLLVPITLCVTGVAWWLSGDAIRALAVLVTATPCPLILAAPAAFIGGTSLAARRGILVKGGGPLETLAHIHTVMFDKTGTLTVGGARLVAVETAPGVTAEEALRLAASLEQASHHVLAATIVSTARGRGLSLQVPKNVREVLGSGLEGVVEGRKVSVGSLQFVHGEGRLEEWARRAARRASWRSALTVFVSIEGHVIAVMLFADELRRETPRAIQALRRAGVSKIAMVTGDRAEPAETIGAALDLDSVLAERVPSDKVDAVVVERRLAPTLMVGDGINDAPALAAADVGLAMGARGASASSEAADAVILVDRLDRVAEVVAIAKRTRAIAMQSIVAGMGLSGVAMIAAAFGYVSPVAGALIQETIDVAVILNALRALAPPAALYRSSMSEVAAGILREEHERLEQTLERLRQVADALDCAQASEAVNYVLEANRIVQTVIVNHEREDEASIYPKVSSFLPDAHGLSAMSRAHREILHQARLLGRLAEGLGPGEVEPYLIRDAQRIIESIESLVRIHNAQEEDIYEHAVTRLGLETPPSDDKTSITSGEGRPTAFERALEHASNDGQRWQILASVLGIVVLVAGGAYWVKDYFLHSRQAARLSPANEITVTGALSDSTMTPVGANISGVIEAVSCDVGSFVKSGQVCARIDPRPYQLVIERGNTDFTLAINQLRMTQNQLRRAQVIYERNKALERRGTIASKVLVTLKKAFEQRQTEFEHAQAGVARARTAIAVAAENLERTAILSPIDGTVIVRTVDVGQRVGAGQPAPLFRIAADPDHVKFNAVVDARAASSLHVGDRALITIKSEPNRSFEGQVTAISLIPQAPGSTTNYNVVITAASPNILLKPEISAIIKITLDSMGSPMPHNANFRAAPQ